MDFSPTGAQNKSLDPVVQWKAVMKNEVQNHYRLFKNNIQYLAEVGVESFFGESLIT
jgi:hypothetical protein